MITSERFIVALGLALLASCGDDAAPPEIVEPRPQVEGGGGLQLFSRKDDWKVEVSGSGIFDDAVLSQLREALELAPDAPTGNPFVWIADENVPFWRRNVAGASAHADTTVWRLSTEFPYASAALKRFRARIEVRFKGEALRRVDNVQPADLEPKTFALYPAGIFAALPGAGQDSAEGLSITYPTDPKKVVGHLKPLIAKPNGLPERGEITLDRETRRCILLPPPTQLAIEAELRGPSSLHLEFAIDQTAWGSTEYGMRSRPSTSDGVGFRLSVREGATGETKVAWEQFLNRRDSNRFQKATIDLKPWADQRVTLLLSSFGGAGGNSDERNIRDDVAYLADPILVTKQADGKERPNVLWVVIDTLRADMLGCNGAAYGATPVMDALAKEGTNFLHARSSTSWTLPSHASMFTSLLPNQHGTLLDKHVLSPEYLTIAEILQFNGWRTAAFTGAGYLLPTFGLHQGFDVFSARDEAFGDKVQLVRNWIRDNTAPFFLFLQTYQVHSPYDPPEPFRSRFVKEYRGKLPKAMTFSDMESLWRSLAGQRPKDEDLAYIRDLYTAELAYTDHCLGILIEDLKKIGRWDDTLVIVTSDHGEEFWDHGDHNHGSTLFEEVLRVPLLVHYPGKFVGGQRMETAVRLEDIAPTILEIVDLPLPPFWTGKSLLDLGAPRDYFATIAYKEYEASLVGTMSHAAFDPSSALKFIQAPKGFNRANPSWSELGFDLRADPLEQRPLQDPSAMEALRRRMPELLKIYQQVRSGGIDSASLDEETLRQLQALGYLQAEGSKD